MQRLTSRNQDNSIFIERVSGHVLLNHLAECEETIEKYEQIIRKLEALEREHFYKYNQRYENLHQGKYTAYHKCVELLKGVKNGR